MRFIDNIAHVRLCGQYNYRKVSLHSTTTMILPQISVITLVLMSTMIPLHSCYSELAVYD